MGTVSQKLQYLIGTKNAIKTAIEGKGVSVPANTAFRQYATLIDSITTSEQNVPEEYTTLLNTALTLYTGEFSHLMILHEAPYTTFGFLLTDFYVNSYWSTTSEFTAGQWVAVKYDNSLEQWTTQDWSGNDVVSLGGNYAKNIVYCDRSIWYFDIKLYPVGTSGTPASGGADLNIAYGDTAPEDTTKLWIQTEAPESVEISNTVTIEAGSYNMTTLGELSNPAYGIASVAVGNKIYLFGGSGSSYLSTINVFDTETNTITTLATTLPAGAYNMASVAVGNKIYLFGGSIGGTHLNTINVFDIETNTITTLATTLPANTHNIASAAIGNKIYLFGGITTIKFLKTINVFDTETNTITTLATTLPAGADGIRASAVGNKIYLFGGNINSPLSTINVFDTETNTITTLATTLPAGAYNMASVAVGNKIYLFGGSGLYNSYLNTINVFDTETNTITTLVTTLPNAAYGIASASVDTKIYLFGGYSTAGCLNTINIFNAESIVLQNGNILILASTVENIFDLITSSSVNIRIGVRDVYVGNANNKGEAVDAYLYSGTEWTHIS